MKKLAYLLFMMVNLSWLYSIEFYQGGFQGSFFLLSPDARGTALGGSHTASDDNHFASLYNPALLTEKKTQWHAGLAYSSLSLDRSTQALTFGKKVPPEAGAALSLLSVKVGDIVGRNYFGDPTEAFNWSEYRGVLSFGMRPTSQFSVGLNLNVFLHQSVEDVSSNGMGIDLGLFIPFSTHLSSSFMVKNILAKSNWKIDLGDKTKNDSEHFPIIFSGALHSKPMPSMDVYLQEDFFFQQGLGYVGTDIKAGIELQKGSVTARAGLWNTQPSIGFGLPLSKIYSRFDYALLPGMKGEEMSHIFTWVFDK